MASRVFAVGRFGVRRAVCVASLCAVALLASEARACPGCPVGREARQQFYAQDFARNLLIALLPFAVVGLISAGAERIGKRPRNEPD